MLGRHRPRAPPLTRASLRGGREMATGERSKHPPLVEQADGGAARATAILRSPKHLGAVERGFPNVATSVACSGALNPATGAGSRPQTVAMSVCRSPTEKERPPLWGFRTRETMGSSLRQRRPR